MSKPSVLLLACLLVSSFPAAQRGQTSFKASESKAPFVARPCFDYSTVQEPDAVWWKRLEGAKLDLSSALEKAVGEREDVRAGGARFVQGKRSYYQIELWHADSPDPETVRIAADNGELLQTAAAGETCFHHGDLSPEEVREALFSSEVTMQNAVLFAVNKYNHTPHVKQVAFVAQEQDRRYELEIFSVHPNGKNRRWHFVVPGNKPAMRMKIMQSQYAGEPIKEGAPELQESGVMTYDFIVGDGELVKENSIIKAHYRLVLLDNQAIFNSKLSNKPVEFRVSDAQLEGLKLGIKGMRVGGKRKIIMPAELAFGAAGRGNIPAGAVVVADIGIVAASE